jgi:hypothetical protein
MPGIGEKGYCCKGLSAAMLGDALGNDGVRTATRMYCKRISRFNEHSRTRNTRNIAIENQTRQFQSLTRLG